MNTMVQSFGFGERLVRVIERGEQPWFVANDVCAALEIANPRDAVSRLDEDESDDVGIADAIGREQRTTIVSESGVYALIFTSRKAIAKQFRRWVTGEVLPELRRTGRYEIVPSNDDEIGSEQMPDDFDRDRLNLQYVRETRILWGAAAARRIWIKRSMDDVSGPPESPMVPERISSEINRSISEWMEARCEFKPGARAGATALYGDYVRWCRLKGGFEPLGQVMFGRFLTACGILTIRSGVVYRSGLTIRRETEPPVE